MPAISGIGKTVGVVLAICLVCSFLVSTAAVKLQGLQKENQRLDKIRNILVASDLEHEGADPAAVYAERIEPVLIDLASGRRIGEASSDPLLQPDSFDIELLANDPGYGEDLPAAADPARIRRRPKQMLVYFVRDGERVDKVILPIYGMGLWSTLYGFLALERDLRTIAGITFYRHGETPGLGGEVDNPRWRNGWKGKLAFDDEGRLQLRVIKDLVDPSSDAARFQVDGLSGATITTRGVNQLVRYWLGDHGYRPFLARLGRDLRNGTASPES